MQVINRELNQNHRGATTTHLFDFAFLPDLSGLLQKIAEIAVNENWGQNHEYLLRYCRDNFEIAHAQAKVTMDENKQFAVWRVGYLVSADGTPIYVIFEKNRVHGKQPFYLRTVYKTSQDRIPCRSNGNPAVYIPRPDEPEYEIPEYRPDFNVEFNWHHYEEQRSRLPKALQAIENDRAAYLCIFGAVTLSHRLHKAGARIAVPQYYRGAYEYLLPLCMTHDDHNSRPDLVAGLQEDRQGKTYFVKTLLLPEMAYPHARAVATSTAHIRSWLQDP